MQYVPERFTDEEQAVLRPYFTNLDAPVFALVNLPEVVKGALFARYSRSPKSLRRLFLDEFVGDLDLTGDLTVDATVGLRRAEDLYRGFLAKKRSVASLGTLEEFRRRCMDSPETYEAAARRRWVTDGPPAADGSPTPFGT